GQRERRFSGGFRSEHFDDASTGQTSPAERKIERKYTRGNALHVGVHFIELHDCAFAVCLLNLLKSAVECFFSLRADGFMSDDFHCSPQFITPSPNFARVTTEYSEPVGFKTDDITTISFTPCPTDCIVPLSTASRILPRDVSSFTRPTVTCAANWRFSRGK